MSPGISRGLRADDKSGREMQTSQPPCDGLTAGARGYHRGCIHMKYMVCCIMINENLNTTLHTKLVALAKTSAGFGASEITGYSAEQVRRAAEMLVKAEAVVRFKVSPRRVRYFASDDIARKYSLGRASSVALAARGVPGSRVKANWAPDEPMRITSKTKIFRAPPLPRNVFRTNTYSKF